MSYEQPDNDAVDFTLEAYSQPDNDAVNFSLEEGAPAPDGSEGFDVDTNPLDLPLALNLPMGSLNLSTMQTGVAIFLFGTWSMLLGASAFFKNYAAGILIFMAVMAALFSGLMNIGLEVHWVLIVATLFALAAGMVVRWMQ